jgi:CubicO group peptidase (beta-lactamase class C family)
MRKRSSAQLSVPTDRAAYLWLVLGSFLSFIVCLILMLPSGASAAPAASPATTVGRTTSTRIEDYVQQQASAFHIPGTAMGIVNGSQPVLLRGFGNSTADTSFFLESLSKSFTALAIMQLVDQGKVNLDAPVRKYIPWFKIGDGSESSSITVLQVLDQTSGISTQAGLTELNFTPATTFVQAIHGFETFPLTARPGTLFQYSNANYTIAGYIIQQASGQSYDSYVQQHIFAPLGMTHTYMSDTVRQPGLSRGNLAWFGLMSIPVTDLYAPPIMPAGGIISSVSDMTHYLIAQMNGGVYNGTRIVSAKAMQEMHAPLSPVNVQGLIPDATSYGMGWGVGTISGLPVIVHGGQSHDFDAEMAILPEQKIAVVVLMNQDPQILVSDENKLYDGIMQGITTGTFPSINQTFNVFYGVFDAIVLATLLLMIRSFWRTGRWVQKFRGRVKRIGFWWATASAVGLDLAIAALIAVAVVYGLGSLFGFVPLTPAIMNYGAPDVAAWIYAIILFFLVRPVVRVIVIASRGT